MKRILYLAIFILMFQSEDGFCGFTIKADGMNAKRLVQANDNVLVMDGKSLLLINTLGEKIASSELSLDNSFLLQDAVYNNGIFYLLYQHSNGLVEFSVLALNSDLSIKWLNDYQQQGSTFGYAMAICEDGVLIAGRSCSPGFFLCSIDALGNVDWTKTYDASNFNVIPSGLIKTSFGYTIAYEIFSGNSPMLAMLSVDNGGTEIQSSVTSISSDFYIKDLVANDNGFAVMLNRPEVSLNTLITFNNNLQANQSFDISSTNGMQLTSLAYINGQYAVGGNILQTGSNNLDLVYATLNLNETIEAFRIGTSGYDDARDIKIISGNIWVGGVTSGSAYVMSFSPDGIKPCSYQALTLTLQSSNISSTSYNSSVTSSAFTVQSLSCNVNSNDIDVNMICSSQDVTTQVENVHQVVLPSSFNLYPNPNNGHFNVTCDNATELTVFDITGKRIYTQKIVEKTADITVQNVTAGLYLVVMRNDSHQVVSTQRMIVIP